MRGPRKYDPAAIEKEFVTGTDSIRTLATRVGVAYSSMAKHARDHDWAGKRVAYQAALERRVYEHAATETAGKEAVIRDESVNVLRATLRAYAQRLATGEVPVTTKDAVEAVRMLADLLRPPSDGGQNTSDKPNDRYKPDADILRRVGEAARKRLAEQRDLAGAAGSEPEGTLPN